MFSNKGNRRGPSSDKRQLRLPWSDRYPPSSGNHQREKGAKTIEALVRTVSFSRLGKPEDIAGAVAILASNKDPFITGQALSVSGGLTMC